MISLGSMKRSRHGERKRKVVLVLLGLDHAQDQDRENGNRRIGPLRH